MLVARDQARLDDAAARLTAEGLTASAQAADLSERDDVERLCLTLDEEGLTPDILVSSTGVNPRPPMAELTDSPDR